MYLSAYYNVRLFERESLIIFDEVQLFPRARADITKHAVGYEMKVAGIFDEIPVQLAKHEKKFKLSAIRKFMQKYHAQSHTPYVLHTSDLKTEDDGID